jgi:hypothetical protein
MLRTFGRIMPVLMPVTVILAAVFAAMSRHAAPTIRWLRIAAALCIALTVASSLIVNVPMATTAPVRRSASTMRSLCSGFTRA